MHSIGPANVPDIWAVKKINPQSMVHLTEKPVALAVRAIQYSSKPGENVLDLFGGSSSTLMGAEETGRHAFLMELDPAYTDVIVLRWQEATGQKAVLDGEGRTYDEVAAERVASQQEQTVAKDLISQREYARRRGVSHVAVQRAIASGRITTAGGKIDPAQADREWQANTDQSKPRNRITGRPKHARVPGEPSEPMDFGVPDESPGANGPATGYAKARAADSRSVRRTE